MRESDFLSATPFFVLELSEVISAAEGSSAHSRLAGTHPAARRWTFYRRTTCQGSGHFPIRCFGEAWLTRLIAA